MPLVSTPQLHVDSRCAFDLHDRLRVKLLVLEALTAAGPISRFAKEEQITPMARRAHVQSSGKKGGISAPTLAEQLIKVLPRLGALDRPYDAGEAPTPAATSSQHAATAAAAPSSGAPVGGPRAQTLLDVGGLQLGGQQLLDDVFAPPPPEEPFDEAMLCNWLAAFADLSYDDLGSLT
jgi:hypothetical protein